MYHSFIRLINFFTIHPNNLSVMVIGALIALALCLTKDPLVLLALLMWPVLQSQQVLPHMSGQEDPDEGIVSPIGFTADIK